MRAERGAIAAKADALEEPVDLLTGEDGGKGVVIAGANLGEESSVAVMEEIGEEEAGCGDGLTDGFWLPIGELGHGRVGMLVIDRINKLACGGTEAWTLG